MNAERLEDRQLLAIFSVVNTNDDIFSGSLRRAILDANTTPGLDEIRFAIAGSGVHTINLNSALPNITSPVTIDGTSQPGYSSIPLVEINGLLAGLNSNGLRLSASSTIKALTINNFGAAGIRAESSGNTILGCFIGTNSLGQFALPNSGGGIVLAAGSSNNTIGGGQINQGNLISGNNSNGIALSSGASNNLIIGNKIGTNIDGTAALGNSGSGIDLAGGTFNQIGGQQSGERNIISANRLYGIHLSGLATRLNTIQSNYIGTNASGLSDLGNSADGVFLNGVSGNLIGGTDPQSGNLISGNDRNGIYGLDADSNAIFGNSIGTGSDGLAQIGNGESGIELLFDCDNNSIGGTLAGAGNVIAYNGTSPFAFNVAGVLIYDFFSTGNAILSNSIHSNVGLGIDLDADGVTPNDPGDTDAGANQLQNYPELFAVRSGAGQTRIEGSLNSRPNTTFLIEFFQSPQADPTGFGEGQTLVGSLTVTTDANGQVPINLDLTQELLIGTYLTATATDPGNNTSEFSLAAIVERGVVVDLAITKSDTPDPATVGVPLTYTLTVAVLGQNPATNIQVTDFLPAGVTYVSATTSTGDPVSHLLGVVTATFPTLAAGATATVTINVIPNQIGRITNSAEVTSSDIDRNNLNNSIVETTQVKLPADVSVTLAGSVPSSIPAGGTVNYEIDLFNNGSGPATEVVLVATLPGNVVIGQISSSQGQPGQRVDQGNTITLTFPIGMLMAQLPARVVIPVTPPVNAPDTRIDLQVTAREHDPNLTDNTTSKVVIIVPAADLSLNQGVTPDSVLTGEHLTYSFLLINNGPLTATNVKLTDALPSGVQFVSAQLSPFGIGTIGLIGGVVQGDIPQMTMGQAVTGTIEVQVTASHGDLLNGILTNSIVVQSDLTDSDLTNNSITYQTAVNPADVGVRIETSPAVVQAGSNLTYTITASNNSPSAAENVTLTFTLPAGLSPISPPTLSQGTILPDDPAMVVADLGSLAGFGSATMTVVLLPPLGTSSLITSATVANPGQHDPNPLNNTAPSNVLISPVDLEAVMEVVNPTGGVVGQNGEVSYRITARNLGTLTASSVSLITPIPAGTTFASAVPGTGVEAFAQIGNSIAASVGLLAPGETAFYTLVLRASTIGPLTVTASVDSDQIDANETNNLAQAAIEVVALPGKLEFAQANYATTDIAQDVDITVRRVNGSDGTLVVNYSTLPGGTAQATIDYVPISGTLVFGPGETQKAFRVTTARNPATTGPRTVMLGLTPTGQGELGSQTTSVLTIQDTDVDTVSPLVGDVRLSGNARSITAIGIVFNEPMDPVSVTNPANYALIAGASRTSPGGPVAITAVIYDPATRTALLTPARALNSGLFHELTVRGTVTDQYGNPLDGDGNGLPGGDHLFTFARGVSLGYRDQNGDAVNLRLAGNGVIDLVRLPSGEARLVRLIGVNRRSTISGTVNRGPVGDGVTSLGDIYGIGSFYNGARSTLTTPPFYANSGLPVTTLRSTRVPRIPRFGR